MSSTTTTTLADVLTAVVRDARLAATFNAIADATAQIADTLRSASVGKAGTTNVFGDHQLEVDVIADKIVFNALRDSGAVSVGASEENPVAVPLHQLEQVQQVSQKEEETTKVAFFTQEQSADARENGLVVTFDPLDGSSCIAPNFAVGSIFGIWPHGELIGRKCGDQLGSAISIYGPRDVLAIAIPASAAKDDKPHVVELTHIRGVWQVTIADMKIAADGKVFAPGNLRATADNPSYQRLVNYWISSKKTLRYTGAMVPDVFHILVQGNGVFCNPPSKTAPLKLRLLYEVAPLSLMIEAAGGRSTDGLNPSVMDRRVSDYDERCAVALGSSHEVARFLEYNVVADGL
ncbi:sedoheptulose-bisphosphatase [Capsaspora owczarzaki ATCC 30864]|uniref:Sedoheptulose-bisphosphatase n=2 Tax=Capsaspora owczarzaki (strain ATCC 30864) TaxID=595528 RepID=A0A0D2X574_CAPO3|nr:sedoheptulose-bisphosphatase [Capsaspora owczarzaki ATCC 30864]